jgi:hypothetical protein
LTATLQGKDMLRLTARCKTSGPISVVTTAFDEFDEYADRTSKLLNIPSILTLTCSHTTAADFVHIDRKRHILAIEALDGRRSEITFDAVSAVMVVGDHEPSIFDYVHDNPRFEYAFHTSIEFSDGSHLPLRTFASLEPRIAERSSALLAAMQLAEYLRKTFQSAPLKQDAAQDVAPISMRQCA